MRQCLWIGLLAALGAAAGGAMDWKTLRPEGYVSDFARVIDPASHDRLEQYCAEVERTTGAQLALVTIGSLEGEPVEDVARVIFNDWGVGHQGKNDGIMLLLSVGDRRYRLETGYGLGSTLPNGLAASVLSEMGPALRQQNYGEALLAAAQTIGETVAGAKHVALGASPPRKVTRTVSNSIPWPLVLGGIALLMWLLRAGGPRGYGGFSGGGFLPGLILGGMMGRGSWGDRGSGGFGGYDSSDGFGGFGGGDSGGGGGFGGFGGGMTGGGGASGSW
jgi:uncharacterized protein